LIEEILPGFFLLKLPFPRNPLRDCNVYLIRGDNQYLMVDSGMDIEECRSELITSTRKLGVDLTRTAFLLTHSHPDHTGNIAAIARADSTIYFGRPDALNMRLMTPEIRQKRAALNIKNGLPNGDLLADSQFKMRNPMSEFAEKRDYDFAFLDAGRELRIGDYVFTAVPTPGHTKGHVCLYEKNKRIFLSGDHILEDVSPIIFAGGLDENPLGDYLASLEKVNDLAVDIVLPGHRRTFTAFGARIAELKRHHESRAQEAMAALSGGPLTAYEIAAQMTWDVKERTWEGIPIWQRLFATSEALAHLRYLVELHKIRQAEGPEKILFSLA
jgi:glyoxylase-like metal-dependent hydrolase (beta-lactamase superfamily II)